MYIYSHIQYLLDYFDNVINTIQSKYYDLFVEAFISQFFISIFDNLAYRIWQWIHTDVMCTILYRLLKFAPSILRSCTEITIRVFFSWQAMVECNALYITYRFIIFPTSCRLKGSTSSFINVPREIFPSKTFSSDSKTDRQTR